MTKDPNFVSVRLPDDVANWLREYATTNKLIRADKPNMGGSIIAIVRAAMQGQTISNNVGQSSAAPDVDIESMISEAIAPLLTRLEAVETKLSTEATAPRKFYSSTTSESEGSSAAKVEASSSIEQLPILDAIEALPTENPSPDETLRDAIATIDKTKSGKRSAKSKSKYTRDQLEPMKNPDIRKIYRAEIPVSDRALDPNYASKADMIDAILTAKPHT